MSDEKHRTLILPAEIQRPEIEEFIYLCSDPDSPWGMADLDAVEICKYVLHLESRLSVVEGGRLTSSPDKEETALDTVIREWSLMQERDDPNVLGEILRCWAFPGEGYGCYSTFDVRAEFVKRPISNREFFLIMGQPPDEWWDDGDVFERASWFAHPNGIEVGWFWDGDGTLVFLVPEIDGVLSTTDCKHNNEWRLRRHKPPFAP